MSFKSQTEVLIKGAIGATGTFTSVILETVSVVISIIAGIATTLYMVQSWRNARDKGEAFKEDRNNGKS